MLHKVCKSFLRTCVGRTFPVFELLPGRTMSSDNIEKVSFTFADVVCFVFSRQTELLQIRKSWKLNFLAERQVAEIVYMSFHKRNF